MKILVLVLGARAAPYPALIRTIKRTWASVSVDGVDTLFYYGGDSLSLDGRDLVLPVPDGPLDIGRKTIACFGWCLANRDFDLIFRTNCSSYVALANMARHVAQHGRRCSFYSGRIGHFDGRRFASGSGYFLSRDLVEHAVAAQGAWNHELLDDVALSDLLASEGVEAEPAPRVDYRGVNEIGEVDTSQFHFRCRTESRHRRDDVRVMRKVHRAFDESAGRGAVHGGLVRRLLGR